jgi:hypothetical protein
MSVNSIKPSPFDSIDDTTDEIIREFKENNASSVNLEIGHVSRNFDQSEYLNGGKRSIRNGVEEARSASILAL